jgi:hypothetical protein
VESPVVILHDDLGLGQTHVSEREIWVFLSCPLITLDGLENVDLQLFRRLEARLGLPFSLDARLGVWRQTRSVSIGDVLRGR